MGKLNKFIFALSVVLIGLFGQAHGSPLDGVGDIFVYPGRRGGIVANPDGPTTLANQHRVGRLRDLHIFNFSLSFGRKLYQIEGMTSLRLGESLAPDSRHILLYYGNGSSVGELASNPDFIDRLRAVFGPQTELSVIDYPGYGNSEGETSEPIIVASAKAALAFLDREGGLAGRSLIVGHSLGAAIATQVAASTHQYSKVILLNPFDRLASVAGPVGMAFTSDRYESIRFAPSIDKPLVVSHGEADKLIKIRHGRRLFSAFPEGAKVFISHPYDHDAALEPTGSQMFFQIWAPIVYAIRSLN